MVKRKPTVVQSKVATIETGATNGWTLLVGIKGGWGNEQVQNHQYRLKRRINEAEKEVLKTDRRNIR